MATRQSHQAARAGAAGHNHSRDHRAAGKRSLLLVLGLIACQIAIETTGGILSGSLGLLAHATHVVTDAVAIGLALFAMWIAERPAAITRTFGYQRIEVLVVLLNAVALCVLASWIFYGAYQRFNGLSLGHDHELHGGILLTVAITGLLINTLSACTLYRSSGHSIAVEGAFWHMVFDLSGSVAVVISGVLVLIFDWDIVDPIISVPIGILIMSGSFRLAMKVFRILLEDTPAGMDMYQLCSQIEDVEGVTLVHDVHAWTITTNYNSLSAHVLVDSGYQGDIEELMRRTRQTIREGFDVHHITLQMERETTDCWEHHHVDHLAATSLHREVHAFSVSHCGDSSGNQRPLNAGGPR